MPAILVCTLAEEWQVSIAGLTKSEVQHWDLHQQREGFVQLCGAWLPAALGHSSVPDNKWGQRSQCCFMSPSHEYQLEKKAQQTPHPADQRASEGERITE